MDPLELRENQALRARSPPTSRAWPLILGTNLGKTGTSSLAAAVELQGGIAVHVGFPILTRMDVHDRWSYFADHNVTLLDDE